MFIVEKQIIRFCFCFCVVDEKKLFTTKEMKAITAKHYKKLPEVQQKLHDNKEKQIKFANRLLADIFNKVGKFYLCA